MTVDSRRRQREVLAQSPLFRSLDHRELEQLLDISRLQKLEAGEIVFRKGQEPDRVCAVVRGRAAVTTTSTKGREIQICLLESGDVFGEIAVIDGRPRTSDVVITERSELIVIERGRFRRFLLDHPQVALKLLTVMAEKLRDTTGLLEDSVFLGTVERLAKVLVSLAHSHGVEDDDGTRIAMLLSQQEIGNMTGCARESVNRQLRRWVSDGILSFDQGEVKIKDLDTLEDIASGIC